MGDNLKAHSLGNMLVSSAVVGNPRQAFTVLGETSWVMQEYLKGDSRLHAINLIPGSHISCEGGWGRNAHYPLWLTLGSMPWLSDLTREDVIEHPLFTPFRNETERMSSTNLFSVAIGTDANGDGNLSVEEAAYASGWDCGRWFCRDRDANKTEEAIAKPCRLCISAKCTSEMDKSASFCAFRGNASTDVPPTVRETGYLKVASVLARRFCVCLFGGDMVSFLQLKHELV